MTKVIVNEPVGTTNRKVWDDLTPGLWEFEDSNENFILVLDDDSMDNRVFISSSRIETADNYEGDYFIKYEGKVTLSNEL